jgi:hypothetical protein
VDIEIGEQGKNMLIEALEKSESLNELHLALYDKIKGAGGPPDCE